MSRGSLLIKVPSRNGFTATGNATSVNALKNIPKIEIPNTHRYGPIYRSNRQ